MFTYLYAYNKKSSSDNDYFSTHYHTDYSFVRNCTVSMGQATLISVINLYSMYIMSI